MKSEQRKTDSRRNLRNAIRAQAAGVSIDHAGGACSRRRKPTRASQTILNVSYDPTREFYEDFDAAFAKHWKAKTGED